MKTNGISELLGDSLSEGHGLKDTLMSFISPDMPVQKEVEALDTETFIKKAEDTLAQVESKTSVIEDKLAALDAEKVNYSLIKVWLIAYLILTWI